MLQSRNFIFIAIVLAGVVLVYLFLSTMQKPTEISLDEAIAMSQSNEIKQFVIDGDELIITTINGTEMKTVIGNLNYLELQELVCPQDNQ